MNLLVTFLLTAWDIVMANVIYRTPKGGWGEKKDECDIITEIYPSFKQECVTKKTLPSQSKYEIYLSKIL